MVFSTLNLFPSIKKQAVHTQQAVSREKNKKAVWILVVAASQALSCVEYTNWICPFSNIPPEAIRIIQSLSVTGE